MSNVYNWNEFLLTEKESYDGIGSINEAGLSRLVDRVQNHDFAILTAFRGEHDLKANKKRNSELLRSFNDKKMGGYLLVGHWEESTNPDIPYAEAKSKGQVQDVVEDSILVVRKPDMDIEEFKGIIVDAMNKYNQDSVILGINGEGIFLYYRDGNVDKIGDKITLNKIGQAYSEMKNKKGVPFVFEGQLSPINNISKQAFKMFNIKWT